MRILAIETSCDETAISIVEAKGGLKRPTFKLLGQAVSSQIKLHAKWGGVVPNLAKREHEKNLIPVLEQVLTEAKMLHEQKRGPLPISKATENKIKTFLIKEQDLIEPFLNFIPKLKLPKIDAIAVTEGPGLEPALWVGINFARALSLVWQKPLIPTNHMEGHIVSPLLNPEAKLTFPALALLISGGHTELVLIKDWLKYKVVGQTRDDAVGEAFDKVARILGLPYPGGPEISKLADRRITDQTIKLPRPMIKSGDLDFSFSGLKTAVLYLVKKLELAGPLSNDQKAAVAHEFQQAVIEVLLAKSQTALPLHNAKTLIIGGGVISNTALREAFTQDIGAHYPEVQLLIPELKLATDNATMIAMAAYLRTQKKAYKIASKIIAQGNLTLK